MDYEAALNQSLDLLADGEERKAERALQGIIDHLKGRLDGTREDINRFYYWGRALTAMEEYEQALLKFEKVLNLDPEHEPSLWETASIFLHDLDNPESAQALLSGKLLPKSPANPMYEEALKAAEFLLRLKKSPPPEAGGARPAGKAAPGSDKETRGGSGNGAVMGAGSEAGDGGAEESDEDDWAPDEDLGPKL